MASQPAPPSVPPQETVGLIYKGLLTTIGFPELRPAFLFHPFSRGQLRWGGLDRRRSSVLFIGTSSWDFSSTNPPESPTNPPWTFWQRSLQNFSTHRAFYFERSPDGRILRTKLLGGMLRMMGRLRHPSWQSFCRHRAADGWCHDKDIRKKSERKRNKGNSVGELPMIIATQPPLNVPPQT